MKQASAEKNNKNWSTPSLTRYGSIAEMTQTRAGSIADNYQNNCNHQGINTNLICGDVGGTGVS